MSGPNPPGRDPEEPDPADEPAEPESDSDEFDQGDELEPLDGGEVEPAAETDAYSRAYSAPESELFSSPYMPGDLSLYDYDSYDEADGDDDRSPRWPWVVGVAAILAAISLVVAVSLLVTRTSTSQLANPATTTSSTPPVQDQITTTKPPPPPPPPPPSSEPPPPPTVTPTATETQTVTVTTAATAAAANHRRASACDQPHCRGTTANDHDAGRPAAGHLLGDRHQSPWRHYLGHVCRRVWSPADAAQRVHSLVDDRHTHLAVGRGFGGGVQPLPGQQTQLLDHHQ